MGSPRYGGNSDMLLDSALKGAEEGGANIQKVRVCDISMSPCIECHGCDDKGKCIVGDGMQNLYPKLVDVDRLFLASPIFFMGLSAQTKAMIDRCQCIWVRKYVLKQTIGKGRENRKGFFIAVGGSKNPDKFIGAEKTVRAFFATLDFTYEKELFIAGVDEMGKILKHPTALDDARRIGRELVEFQ